jgi:hypothetical protein
MPHRLKIVLLAGQLLVGALDSRSTRLNEGHGGQEVNPLGRPFVHTPALYASNAALSLGAYWLGRRMEKSKHVWVRKANLAPQLVDLAGHSWGLAYTRAHGAGQ